MSRRKTIKVPLNRGKFALVDAADFKLVGGCAWFCLKNGYAVRNVWNPITKKASGEYMHRLIAGTPPGMHTDHINGDKLDNRRCNLRICTRFGNMKNLKLSKANKTGFKGVDFQKSHGRFRAQIMSNRILYHLGGFDAAQEAGHAYDLAAARLHGEFSRLNKKLK